MNLIQGAIIAVILALAGTLGGYVKGSRDGAESERIKWEREQSVARSTLIDRAFTVAREMFKVANNVSIAMQENARAGTGRMVKAREIIIERPMAGDCIVDVDLRRLRREAICDLYRRAGSPLPGECDDAAGTAAGAKARRTGSR